MCLFREKLSVCQSLVSKILAYVFLISPNLGSALEPTTEDGMSFNTDI